MHRCVLCSFCCVLCDVIVLCFRIRPGLRYAVTHPFLFKPAAKAFPAISVQTEHASVKRPAPNHSMLAMCTYLLPNHNWWNILMRNHLEKIKKSQHTQRSWNWFWRRAGVNTSQFPNPPHPRSLICKCLPITVYFGCRVSWIIDDHMGLNGWHCLLKHWRDEQDWTDVSNWNGFPHLL